MRRFALLPVLLAAAACARPPETPQPVDMNLFGGFEYTERMELPGPVIGWNGKLVKTTGYMNPRWELRGLTQFELVKDRNSCCFGSQPKINHFFAVSLKPGVTTDHSNEPVTLVGRLRIQDLWDGDWQVGLYFLDEAIVVK